jgi:DNA-binding response OmpR family regulator
VAQPVEEHRVLIVDDDEACRTLMERWLRADGFEVVSAKDGYEALRLATETPPNVILLDLSLPGLNGFEYCEAVRRVGRLKSVPIILVTGLHDPWNAARARELGASDVVLKPLHKDELRAMVRLAVEGASSPDAPR